MVKIIRSDLVDSMAYRNALVVPRKEMHSVAEHYTFYFLLLVDEISPNADS